MRRYTNLRLPLPLQATGQVHTESEWLRTGFDSQASIVMSGNLCAYYNNNNIVICMVCKCQQ